MPAYSRLEGDTYYVRGSPSSIIYVDSDTVYVVDPGHGGGKLKSITKTLKDLAREGARRVAVVTHHHSDHLELIARRPGLFDETAATRQCASGIESPTLRIAATFGYPLAPDAPSLPFKAPPVRVTILLDPDGELGPLKLVPLPGHTAGQIGVLTPDGVLYAADSVFGPRVLERYKLPYHLDPCTARESLESLLENREWRILAPGHGPVLDREQGEQMIKKNIEVLDGMLGRMRELAASRGEASTGEVVEALVAGPGVPGPGLYMLLEQTVRGALACLSSRGVLEPVVGERGLRWRIP